MDDWSALAAPRGGMPVLPAGHVWLAGAGPGDPGLLTLYALAGLAHADVIVHDALVDKRVLALARPQAGLEFAGKRGGRPSAVQADISKRLIELAKRDAGYCASGRGSLHLRTWRRGRWRSPPPASCSGSSQCHLRVGRARAASIPATLRQVNRPSFWRPAMAVRTMATTGVRSRAPAAHRALHGNA